MKGLYIKTQRYPCHDGSLPLSYAIYHDSVFLAYSWSLRGAWLGLKLIKETTMDYRIPDHDSILDSSDRREQEREPEVDEADDEDTWEDDDDD